MRGGQLAALTIRSCAEGLIHSDPRRRTDDASLPRSAAEHLADASGMRDEGLRADDDAAYGRTETFAEAQGNGVEETAEIR